MSKLYEDVGYRIYFSPESRVKSRPFEYSFKTKNVINYSKIATDLTENNNVITIRNKSESFEDERVDFVISCELNNKWLALITSNGLSGEDYRLSRTLEDIDHNDEYSVFTLNTVKFTEDGNRSINRIAGLVIRMFKRVKEAPWPVQYRENNVTVKIHPF